MKPGPQASESRKRGYRQFAVIGLGRFGQRVATGLYQMGAEVLAIDSDAAKVAAIKQQVTAAVCLDSAREEAVRSLGVDNMDAVVVAIGRDVQASILTTALLQQAGCPYIVARASNELHAQILGMVGANRVIYPEDEEAKRLVRGLASPHVLDQVDLVGDLELAVLKAPRSFCGKSLVELGLRQKYTVNVVAIRTAETDTQAATTIFPDAHYVLQPQDQLYVVGPSEGLRRLDGLD
ncbi:MAG: TrkA family potassium uptake protein [Armatimonadetes bacterium]|nr:TrkA family potassium uptake protein [Armatimonadota bacterium]